MAYNKDDYENNRLTPQQEIFVDEILKGTTQYAAYLKAYPKAKKWQRNTVDSRASVLMNNKKIIKRLEQAGWKDKKHVEWTRKRALNTINHLLEMHERDLERIEEACQTEIDLLEVRLGQYAQKLAQADNMKDMVAISSDMQDITETIAKLKKQRRVNSVNTNGILNAAKVLNRMFGLDVTKVEIVSEDNVAKENLKQLTVEELRAIAYANRNNRSTGEGS